MTYVGATKINDGDTFRFGSSRLTYDASFGKWKVVFDGSVIQHAATFEAGRAILRSKGVKYRSDYFNLNGTLL